MTRARPAHASSQRVAASFRDPSGYVLRRGRRIYRAIDLSSRKILGQLAEIGFLQMLMDEGTLVRTRDVQSPVELARLVAENPGYEHFLQHQRISPVTYPYEWSISMLADAALLTLRLQLQLLEVGCALKDASAYNVQFCGGRPVFIDFGSIQRPARKDLWYALGQFHRMFTFPIMLCRLKGWDLRSYFLGALGGRSVDDVVRAFGRVERWRPACLLDVTLPWLLTPRNPRNIPTSSAATTDPAPGDDRAQRLNLRRLERKLRKLAQGYRPSGHWVGYATQNSYDSVAEAAKRDLVRTFLEFHRPRRVLDLGSNTGQYSRLAAQCGAQVIAIDQSHDAIEVFYRQLRQNPAPITPMVVDLASPSPGIGFRNQERAAFSKRVRGDCVLALALVHHLVVDGNLSLEAIRDQLADLTRRDLVLEYVPPGDPMFQRLAAGRRQTFEDLTLDRFQSVFASRFELLDQRSLPNSPRSLLFLRKRT